MNDVILYIESILYSGFILGGIGSLMGLLTLKLRGFKNSGKWGFNFGETAVIFILGSFTAHSFSGLIPASGFKLPDTEIVINRDSCLTIIGSISPFLWVSILNNTEVIAGIIKKVLSNKVVIVNDKENEKNQDKKESSEKEKNNS